MPDTDDQLRVVLKEYDNFLREKDLAPPKHRPYLVRWVRFVPYSGRSGYRPRDSEIQRTATPTATDQQPTLLREAMLRYEVQAASKVQFSHFTPPRITHREGLSVYRSILVGDGS